MAEAGELWESRSCQPICRKKGREGEQKQGAAQACGWCQEVVLGSGCAAGQRGRTQQKRAGEQHG